MSIKSVVAGAAFVCLLMTSVVPAHTRASQEETLPTTLTAAEEREARATAREFAERLQSGDDFASLITDFFVPDFSTRLKAEGASFYPLLLLDEGLAKKLDAKESLRCYTLHMDFLAMWLRFQTSERVKRHLRGEEEPDDEPIDKMFPPSVLEILKSNSAYGKAFGGEDQDEEQAQGDAEVTSAADDEYKVKSREELNDLLLTLERANIKFREHLKHSAQIPWSEAQKILAQDKEKNDQQDASREDEDRPRVGTIGRESFLGVLKGSRIICVDVLYFHMDLVDVAGHLEVLAVYLPND